MFGKSTVGITIELGPDTIAALTGLAGGGATQQKLDEILKTLKELKVTDQEVKQLLVKVDATTNRIGANIDTAAKVQQDEANTIQKISAEIDTLLANASGISAETSAQLQDIAERLQASSNTSDAVVSALQAQSSLLTDVAAKGAPVVPPPPNPVVLTRSA